MVDPTTAPKFRDTPEFEQSRQIRNGGGFSADTALTLAKALRNQLALGEARRLVEYAREKKKDELTSEQDFDLLRVQVTCTYKDAELPPERAFTLALQLLKGAGYDPETTAKPEALGLAGAIWKRWWEYDGQRDRLIRSLAYYERGFGSEVTTDEGYQAVNAAYVLDLLASLELGSDQATKDAKNAAENRLKAANEIRQKLIAADEKNPPPTAGESYWYQATIAEAHLGLHQHGQAEKRLRTALTLPRAEPWMCESTARQLAGLVLAHHVAYGNPGPVEESPLWGVVQRAFGANLAEGVRSALIGKVGLALSGGGFRAALYHIGVLARLAELDVLRRIEVLSCVSGGSIVGARYYLEVRRLLQEHPDGDVKREHFIEIVSRMEKDFLAGVQTDLRNSLLEDRAANLRSADDLAYSRTNRLGELYEERLYASVPDGEGTKERYISHLYIEPPDHGDPQRPFNPRLENWRRRAKVPTLVLNATALNTGHSWQFTASWMGEPGSSDPKINSTPPLRRMGYHEAPTRHKKVRLGDAVAASSCVPGIFDPVVFEGLYDDGIALRLVDGGAFDNQGTAGLLEENCSVLLVSDASGQILLQGNPGANPLSVSQRANDVLMARVRETQFLLLSRLQKAGVLRGLMYVHLRDGLGAPPINWIGCIDPPEPATVPKRAVLTDYNMRIDVQRSLAELRTDLDAFSDLEAKALMESGYRATSWHLREEAREVPAALLPAAGTASAEPWAFHDVVPMVATIKQPVEVYEKVVDYLGRGAQVAGRTLALVNMAALKKKAMITAGLGLLLFVAGLLLKPVLTLAVIGLGALAGLGFGVAVIKKLGVSSDLNVTWQRASGRLIGWLGWRRARRQLKIGTPQYLKEGSLDRFR